MVMPREQKNEIKQLLVDLLAGQNEIRKIVVFGSFLKASEPHDIDVAVFQDSPDSYLTLAMKYRRMTRSVSQIIPLDIIPVRAAAEEATFLDEINQGEVIYEK